MSLIDSLEGSETVLLAEDDEVLRDLLFTVLREQGYTVLTAKNGQDAIELFNIHTGSIDLLLTDVVMPYTNGTQLFKKFTMTYPNAKVLFISGYADDVIMQQDLIGAGFHFLQKPFNLIALLSKVREILT